MPDSTPEEMALALAALENGVVVLRRSTFGLSAHVDWEFRASAVEEGSPVWLSAWLDSPISTLANAAMARNLRPRWAVVPYQVSAMNWNQGRCWLEAILPGGRMLGASGATLTDAADELQRLLDRSAEEVPNGK